MMTWETNVILFDCFVFFFYTSCMSSVIEGNTNEQTKTVYINFSNKQASKHVVVVVAVAAVICQ